MRSSFPVTEPEPEPTRQELWSRSPEFPCRVRHSYWRQGISPELRFPTRDGMNVHRKVTIHDRAGFASERRSGLTLPLRETVNHGPYENLI